MSSKHEAAVIRDYNFIVVGGGIAGVTCVETLATLCTEESILLLSSSPIIKVITNLKQLTKSLHEFEVEEQAASSLESRCQNVTVCLDSVVSFDSLTKEIALESGSRYRYSKLCLCTGGQPKLIAENNPLVLGIRDTETVVEFQKKLSGARRVVIVGNGGIATELVYRITDCEVVWAIREASIVSTFVDAGAAKFFLPSLNNEATPTEGPLKRLRYTLADEKAAAAAAGKSRGAALGPDWTDILPIHGSKQGSHDVHIEYEVEVSQILSPEQLKTMTDKTAQLKTVADKEVNEDTRDWPIYVELTNGHVYGCDFVVSATGVTANTRPFTDCAQFSVASDGGIEVDGRMRTSVADVFAAGDVCTAAWTHSPYWLQMRLWNQARQMGCYAAECMLSAETTSESSQFCLSEAPSIFAFELFAHVTKFFGYKVVLLGRYNAQGLDDDYELLIRVVEGKKYLKAVLRGGRMVGAVLIGETDVEEAFENLILNQLDVSIYGEELLSHDIEDYFD